jgi:hypothetical protein
LNLAASFVTIENGGESVQKALNEIPLTALGIERSKGCTTVQKPHGRGQGRAHCAQDDEFRQEDQFEFQSPESERRLLCPCLHYTNCSFLPNYLLFLFQQTRFTCMHVLRAKHNFGCYVTVVYGHIWMIRASNIGI